MEKWIAAEKTSARLRHAVVVVCPNVTGRTKERIAHKKRACAGSYLISHKRRELVSSGRTFVVFLWRYVCFVFVSFSYFLLFLSKPQPFVQPFLDNNMHAPRQPHSSLRSCQLRIDYFIEDE